MANINNRRLPAGIQSFKVIREEGYLYVDKTDIIWNLANNGNKYNYLSRPRRFDKSLLVETLHMYLEGRKDLFKGLKILPLHLQLRLPASAWKEVHRIGGNERLCRDRRAYPRQGASRQGTEGQEQDCRLHPTRLSATIPYDVTKETHGLKKTKFWEMNK